MDTRKASPREIFDSVDWEAWYHEFATERVRSNGQYKYASAFQFAKEKGNSRQTRDVILHVIGPVVKNRAVPAASPYPGIPQFDWERCRREGFWLGPETVKTQIQEIVDQQDAFAALKVSAHAHLLPLLNQISRMMEKVEATFSGQLMLPSLSEKQNEARVQLYMRLQEQVVTQTLRLQNAFAQSLGINIMDLHGTLEVHQALTAKIQNESDGVKKVNRFLGNLIEMTLEKSEALGLPVPDSDWSKVALNEKERSVG